MPVILERDWIIADYLISNSGFQGYIVFNNKAEPLIKALQDRDKEVRDTAKEALLKIIDKHPEIENIIPF